MSARAQAPFGLIYKMLRPLFKNSIVIAIALFAFFGFHRTLADTNPGTNISFSSGEFWAWSDVVGWMDFHYTHSIIVTSQKLTGYASSSVGDFSFDCATARNGDICGQSNYNVANDGLGVLSGWGWNDTYGWVSFNCTNGGTGCGASTYQVTIDPDTGSFCGTGSSSCYAWNDVIGWISFNCGNYSGCGTSNYKVVTAWRATSTNGTLDSSTFDTGIAAGAQLNSVLWHGNQPAGTSVKFQFAVSNSSSGPWSYKGSDGTSNSYYTVGADTSIKLDYAFHSNFRYFRYRIFLFSNQAQSQSPRVDEVIVNWSP